MRRIHIVLGSVFRWAVAEHIIDRNPLEGLPSVPKSRPGVGDDNVWTVDHLRVFLDSSAGERLAPAWRLLAVTGMRRGEILGLTWGDVSIPDIGAPTVTVRRSWVMQGGSPVLRPPKTADSVRTVGIDPATAASLSEWRASQVAEAAAWGDAWDDTGAVFTRENGARYRPDYFSRLFQRAVSGADVPRITPHGLRHTAATALLTSDVPVRVVSDLLGHSDTRTTQDVYQHVIAGQTGEAVQAIADAVDG